MKRPVSLLLLLIFAAVQIYFARVPLSHQVQGSSWIEVSRQAGGLVQRQGTYYLVTPTQSYRLTANQVHITAQKQSLNWVDVPMPSGSGVWKLAMGQNALALVGIGGPVYPAPNGQSVLWIDPATRLGYLSSSGADGVSPLSTRLGGLTRVAWAPDSQAIGVVGQGPQGVGAYLWDGDHNVNPVAVGPDVSALGFSQTDTLMVAFNNGRVMVQGRGMLALPALSPIYLARGQTDVLGETANDVIFWNDWQKLVANRPALKWEGKAVFAADGRRAAILGKTMGNTWDLLTYDAVAHQHLEISLPFSGKTHYHLLGFLGSHWVLVTVPSGPHSGTYAWWIQG